MLSVRCGYVYAYVVESNCMFRGVVTELVLVGWLTYLSGRRAAGAVALSPSLC